MPPHKTAANYHETDLQVGARVRARRMQLGISQTDLARELGVTFQQVQKYEKGANRISSSRLSQIAHATGVTPAYFFQDPLAQAPHGHGVEMKELNAFVGSRDGVALMQAFVRIKDKRLRRTIVDLVRDLED